MSPQRILIVEDEAHVAHALARALTMVGDYQVDRCDSAEDALERLRTAPPYDLLVTDLRMGKMSGLDLLERLPQISPTTRTVLITAYGSPKIEARAKLLANAYLPKPFSTKSFVEVVKQALTTTPLQKRRVIIFSEEGLSAIQARLEHLRTDVEAVGAFLFDQSGQLLTQTGQAGEFDATAFRALLGNTMSAASELGHILQDDETFDLHFHEGKQYEVYATQINPQVFLALLIERQGSASRIGMVWLYLRRAIAELRALVKQAQVEDTATLLDADLAAGVANALDQALGLDESANETPPPVETPLPARRTRRVEFDVDAFLQANPPRRRARKTASENEHTDTQSSTASSSIPTPDPNAVLSYEEARALGLINLDEDSSSV